MSWNKEEDLRLKYKFIDGEADLPHRKKAKRKPHKKSNHKHEYQNIVLVGNGYEGYVSFCTVCGKISEFRFSNEIREHFPHIKPFLLGFTLMRQGGTQEETDSFKYFCRTEFPTYHMPQDWNGLIDPDFIIPLGDVCYPKGSWKFV